MGLGRQATWTAVQAFVAVFDGFTDLSTLHVLDLQVLATLISSVKTVAKDRLKG